MADPMRAWACDDYVDELWVRIAKDGPANPSLHTPLDRRSNLNSMAQLYDEWPRRQAFVKKYAYAVPTKDVVDQIATFAVGSSILEVGAGLGMWSCLLWDVGYQAVVATDSMKTLHAPGSYHYDVVMMDATRAVKMHPECDTLLICWPDFGATFPMEALEAFKGARLVYIGEGNQGCCAEEEFFSKMETEWVHENLIVPRWPTCTDMVHMCTRKKV